MTVSHCQQGPGEVTQQGPHLVKAKEIGPDLGQHLVLEQAEALINRVVDGDAVSLANELDAAGAVVAERLVRNSDLACLARDRLVLVDGSSGSPLNDGLILWPGDDGHCRRKDEEQTL